MTGSETYLDAAKEAVMEAGKLLLDGLGDAGNKIYYKGDIDVVTDMDLKAETLIKDLLMKKFPNISILAEEGGASGSFSGMRWLIDPLDGTTSYSHGLPHFSVSIALEIEGEIEAGVVFNPCLNECFSAIKGMGAHLNGQRIKVSKTKELNRSLLATGFPYDRVESPQNNLDHFNAFILKIHGIRRMGSAALDLCYTAAGRFDGYWEMKLSPWDSAAGLVIVKEAGGTVTGFGGGAYTIYDNEILASNGHIHDKMIEVLQGG